MGTFIIRPTVINSMPSPLYWSGMSSVAEPPVVPGNYPNAGSGNVWAVWSINNPVLNDASVLAALNDTDAVMPTAQLGAAGWVNDVPAGVSFDDTIRVAFIGNSIYLDGSPTPIAFAGLPGGFTATSAAIKVQTHPVIIAPYDPFHVYLQKEFGNDSLDWENLNLGEISFDYDFGSFPAPTILDIYSNAAGLRVAYTMPNEYGDTIFFWNLRVEGTYEIVSISWTLDNEDPVKVGDIIEISSNGVDGLQSVSSVEFHYEDEVCIASKEEFYYQSPDELSLYLPFCLGSYTGVVTVFLVGDGTVFSGSVQLGTLEVFFEDTSGLYKIVKNKKTDTKYDPSRDGTTDEVKIPNPFIATGYVDG